MANCPKCGRYKPPDPATGYDGDDYCSPECEEADTRTPPLEPLRRRGRCPVCLRPIVVSYLQPTTGKFELRGSYPVHDECSDAYYEMRLIKSGWNPTSRPAITHEPHGPGGGHGRPQV